MNVSPLLLLQVRDDSADLMEMMFTRHYVSAYADYVGMNSERGYAQYTESQVTEALEACLHIYNQANGGKLQLVFFKEAMRHAARLSRLLVSTSANTAVSQSCFMNVGPPAAIPNDSH